MSASLQQKERLIFKPLLKPSLVQNEVGHPFTMEDLFNDGSAGGWFSLIKFGGTDFPAYETSLAVAVADIVGDALGLYLQNPRDGRGVVNLSLNNMFGGVDGAPGTLPASWGTGGGGVGTLTRTLTFGTRVNGTKFMRMRLNGTSSTSSYVVVFTPPTTAPVPVTPGVIATGSAYVGITAGSLTNISTCALSGRRYDAAGVLITDAAGTSITSTFARRMTTYTAVTGDFFVGWGLRFLWTSGVAIDITVEVELNQVEYGSSATDVQLNTITRGGPGDHFSMATSGTRPLYGVFPRGYGVINQVVNSALESSLTRVTATTLTGQFFDGTDCRRYLASIDVNTHRVNLNFSCYNSTVTRLQGKWFRKPSGSDVAYIWMRARNAATGGIGIRYVWTAANPAADIVVSPFGTRPPAAITTAAAVVLQHPTSTDWWFLGFIAPTGSTSTDAYTQLDIGFSVAITESLAGTANTLLDVSGFTVSNGTAPLPYQKVSGHHNVSMVGVPSVVMPYMNGTNVLTTSKAALIGGCDFFCDTAFEWALGGAYAGFITGASQSLWGKGTGVSTLLHLCITVSSTGFLTVYARGATTNTGIFVADGQPHSWVAVWDKTNLYIHIDDLAPILCTVGTAVAQTTAVICSGANSTTPANPSTGFVETAFMRSGHMTRRKIEKTKEEIIYTYGVAA